MEFFNIYYTSFQVKREKKTAKQRTEITSKTINNGVKDNKQRTTLVEKSDKPKICLKKKSLEIN